MTGREIASNWMYVMRCLVLATLTLIGLCMVLSCFLPDINAWERDISNREWIEKAYVRFYRDTLRYPTNLLELVAYGYLPGKSSRYMEPPRHFYLSTDAERSCYVVNPPSGLDVQNMDVIGRIYDRSGTNSHVKYSIVDADLRNILVRLQRSRSTNAVELNLNIPPEMR